ncbi:glycerol-3-phosphate acyltransferase [Chloroflexota bacterium]
MLGSISTAYIAARLVTGRDIRRMGGGNVGGLNTLREVGVWPAVVVGIVDIGKGAAAVAIAYWFLDLCPVFVMLAGLGVVIGHNWMVWLRFSGRKGMGSAIGALTILMLLYGYWPGLLIFFGFIAVPLVITRNVALSMCTGLVALPVITPG